jgi:hypothetical protein
MNSPLVQTLAERYRLPPQEVQLLAAEVAERCALIANRYEPQGDFEAAVLGPAKVVGAEIGHAILQEFAPPANAAQSRNT